MTIINFINYRKSLLNHPEMGPLWRDNAELFIKYKTTLNRYFSFSDSVKNHVEMWVFNNDNEARWT